MITFELVIETPFTMSPLCCHPL